MIRPFDVKAEGALYRLNLVDAKVRRHMRRCEVGSARGRELAELVERLDVLHKQARRYADDRFNPAGL